MIEYVAGFLINKTSGHLALVIKNKPAWQAGKLNGIGGKIEAGETPHQAMVREFEEETGAHIEDWHEFCRLGTNDATIHFFVSFTNVWLLDLVRTVEAEQIVMRPLFDVSLTNAIPNLTWLIPMALSLEHDRAEAFVVQEVVQQEQQAVANITVNGRTHAVAANTLLSFSQVAGLAGLKYVDTITYYKRHDRSNTFSGILNPGTNIMVQDGLHFSAANTSRA